MILGVRNIIQFSLITLATCFIPTLVLAVGDPCDHYDLKSVPAKNVDYLFGDDFEKLDRFKNQYEKEPESALLVWLRSLDLFQSMNPEKIEVEKAKGAIGLYNEGIFTVRTPDPHLSYVVKVTDGTFGCNEEIALWRLNESIFAHPECLLRADPKYPNRPVATQEQIKELPKIAQIVASGDDDRRCFQVLEMARGKKANVIEQQYWDGEISDQEAAKIFESIGRKIGAMHFLFSQDSRSSIENWQTWAHQDLHPDNFFYDLETQDLTLIDNGMLSNSRNIRNDLSGSYGKVLTSEVNKNLFKSDMKVLFRDLPNKSLYEKHLHFTTLLESGEFAKTPSKEFSKFLVIGTSFMKGYLSQFPQSQRLELEEIFSNHCRDSVVSYFGFHYGPNYDKNYFNPYLLERFPRLKKCVEKDFEAL